MSPYLFWCAHSGHIRDCKLHLRVGQYIHLFISLHLQCLSLSSGTFHDQKDNIPAYISQVILCTQGSPFFVESLTIICMCVPRILSTFLISLLLLITCDYPTGNASWKLEQSLCHEIYAECFRTYHSCQYVKWANFVHKENHTFK